MARRCHIGKSLVYLPSFVGEKSESTDLLRALMSTGICADRRHMDLSAIALQGLQTADAQLNAAATKIASCGASSPEGAGLDMVDLSAEVVALISARNQTAANLATLHTASEIQKNLIELMA